MGDYRSSTERDSSSINVSVSTLDIDTLVASFDSDPGLRDSLQQASVLIIPTDLSPEYEDPAFPETTFHVMEHLRESLGDSAIVEAAVRDKDYAEFAYRSEDLILPTLYVVDRILLPVVVSCLASFINERLKSRGRPKDESRVEGSFHYFKGKDETRLSLLNYDGPADTFERVLSQYMHDSDSLQNEEELYNR